MADPSTIEGVTAFGQSITALGVIGLLVKAVIEMVRERRNNGGTKDHITLEIQAVRIDVRAEIAQMRVDIVGQIANIAAEQARQRDNIHDLRRDLTPVMSRGELHEFRINQIDAMVKRLPKRKDDAA